MLFAQATVFLDKARKNWAGRLDGVFFQDAFSKLKSAHHNMFPLMPASTPFQHSPHWPGLLQHSFNRANSTAVLYSEGQSPLLQLYSLMKHK